MSFTSTPIAGGTTGTLTDSAPAIDRIASVDYQRVKLADGTADSTTAAGIDSNPLKVSNRRRGTSNYDSGLVPVTNGAPTSVTAATIYPEGGVLSNTAAVAIDVTLTDAAGNSIAVISMAPKSSIPLPVPKSGAWAGLKAGASAAGVVLQVAGGQ